jgi:hypothetical protein
MSEGCCRTAIFCSFTTPGEPNTLEPASGIVGFREDESFSILAQLNGPQFVPLTKNPRTQLSQGRGRGRFDLNKFCYSPLAQHWRVTFNAPHLG